jgi:YD repeat-containing protein
MIHGVKDQPVDEHFTVCDSNGNLITGLDTTTSFTAYVYDPDGNNVTGSVSGSFTELGDGNYKYTFTPNANGVWYVNVTNPTYFPWGKNDDVYVDESDISGIYEIVRKTLGLVHHNMYIDEPVYDEVGNMISARVRIYDDEANVGTDTGVIESYLITADGTQCGQFNYWQQVKI